MKKRIFAFLLSFIMVVFQLPVFANATDVEIDLSDMFASGEVDGVVIVSDAEGYPGDTVSVTVDLEVDVAINTIGLSGLEFDEDILTFTGFSDYSELQGKAILCQFDDAKMTGVAALSSAQKYSGNACTLNFVINDNAVAGESTAISFNNVQLKNGSNIYDYSVVEGTIKVLGNVVVPEEPECENCGGAHETDDCPENEPEEPVSGNVFEIENSAGVAGDEIAIAVFLNTEDKVNTIGLAGLDYDEDVLTFAGFSDYDYLQSKAMLCQFDEDKKTAVAAFTSAQTFDGQICVLNFIINDDAPSGETTVSFNDVQLKNSSVIYDSTVVGGVIEVEGEEGPVCDNCGGAHETEDCPENEPEVPVSGNVFEIENAAGAAGDEIAIAVFLNTEDKVNTIGLAGLDYDEDVLTFAGFSDYDYLQSKAMLCQFDEDKKTAVAAFTSAQTFDGQICVLNFIINDDAPSGETTVSFNDVQLKNSSVIYDSTVVGGVIEVEGEEGPVCENCGGAHETEDCPENEPEEPVTENVFEIENVSAYTGEEIALAVYLSAEDEINTIGFAGLDYDEDVLTFTGFSDYDYLESEATLCKFDEDKLTGVAAFDPAQTFEGQVCVLNFVVNKNAPAGKTTVSLYDIKLKNSAVSYDATVTGGVVEVKQSEPDYNEYDGVFTFSTESGVPGNIVSVDVYLETEVEFNTVGLAEITYDSDILEYVDYAYVSSFASQCMIYQLSVSTENSLIFSAASISGFSGYDGNVITLNFKVLDNAPKGSTAVITAAAPGLKLNAKSYNTAIVDGLVEVCKGVSGVSLDESSLSLEKGDKYTLNATVAPADAYDKSVTWKSSNTSVVNVSNGVVTAVGSGKATVTVTTVDGGFTDKCEVTVTSPVTGVTLNKNSMTLEKGETDTLVATVNPSDASNKNVTWTTSDKSVVTVNNGVVKAVGKGTATVTVKTEDGGFTASCKITVNVPVTGVSLNKNSLELTAGKYETLTATVTPADADDKSVTWKSSNTSVATVSANGKVTAVDGGKATITVTTVDGGFTDTCEVTVIVPVTGIRLNRTSQKLNRGDEYTLTATVVPENATNKNVKWTSSDEKVVKVDDGVVTAVGKGTAKVTVTTVDGGFKAECTFDVSVPVTGVKLSHEEIGMYKGETYTLKAVVDPVDADDTSVTWTSSDDTVATVENGVVTAVSGGSAEIIVKTTDGGFEDVCTVNVIVPVDSITLNESLINLSKDETFTLVATVSPDDAYDKSVAWTSSDESVAMVDNGVVTAKGLGLAIITATSADGKKSAACAVRVNPKEPKAIYTLSDESAREGGTVTVTVELNTKETFNTLGLANITYDEEILTYSG